MSETFRDYQLQVELVSLWNSKKTGVLKCEIGGYEKTLYLRDGAVVFAASNDPGGKLTQVLIDQGKFTQEQYEAVEANFDDDVSTGRNLINVGLITQQELAQGGRQQVYHVFASCMQAETGTAVFEEGDLPDGVVNLPPKLPEAFFKTVLASDDKAWVSRQFGPDLSFVCEKSDDAPIDFSKVEVGDFAAEIYELIDGEADFNHLAFEVDVDDFVLLKFLYALKLLGHIHVAESDGVDDPLADDDGPDIRDELTHALAQSEEIDKLGGVNMDETMQLPKVQNMVEEMGSLDSTMEIPKNVLNQAEPAFADEEDPWGADEGEKNFFEEESFETPADELEVAEEAGLDDLDGMSSQLLEDELIKMQPDNVMSDDLTSEIIMPDPEEEEKEEEPIPGDRRKKVLIFSSAAMFFLSGYLFLAQPHVTFLARFVPKPELIVEMEPEPTLNEEIEAVEEGVESVVESEVDPVNSEANGEEVETVPKKEPEANGEKAETEPSVVKNSVVPDSVPPKQTQQEAEIGEPERHVATETIVSQPESSAVTTHPATDPKRGFNSPVAEGGYPNLGTNKITTVLEKPTASEQKGHGEAPSTRVATSTNNRVEKKTSASANPPRTTPPADLTGLLKVSNFSAAAAGFEQQYKGSKKHTLTLFLGCADKSLRETVLKAQANSKLLVLPHTYNGKSCYWVCWGSFDSYQQAYNAIDSLPAALLENRQEIEPKRLDKLVP